MNAAKARRENQSYRRVLGLLHDLKLLSELRSKIQTPYIAALKNLRSSKLGTEVRFPGISRKSRTYQALDHLQNKINRNLSRYAFNPAVSYSVSYDTWRGGIVPANNRKFFLFEITPGNTVSEADVALSLIRLDLLGELGKVRLCKNCGEKWIVGAKSNYSFCLPECREKFYVLNPEFKARKARNQKAYRLRVKQIKALAK